MGRIAGDPNFRRQGSRESIHLIRRPPPAAIYNRAVMQRDFQLGRRPEYAVTQLFRWVTLCVILQSTTLLSSSDKLAERPRITGIDHVSVYVSDVDKSRHFYA